MDRFSDPTLQELIDTFLRESEDRARYDQYRAQQVAVERMLKDMEKLYGKKGSVHRRPGYAARRLLYRLGNWMSTTFQDAADAPAGAHPADDIIDGEVISRSSSADQRPVSSPSATSRVIIVPGPSDTTDDDIHGSGWR